MALAFVCKILCDISFYFLFAGLFGSFLGLSGPMLPAAGIILLCALLCFYCDRRRPALRYIPLAGLLSCALLIRSAADAVILLLPCLWLALTVHRRRMFPERGEASDAFFLILKILPLLLVIALVIGDFELIKRYCMPYLLAYLLGSVTLLRMLRHDAETMEQPRFRLLNAGALALLCLLCLLVSSEAALAAMGAGLRALYFYLIAPLLTVAGYAMAALGTVLYYILKLLLTPFISKEQRIMQQTPGEAVEELLEQSERIPPAILGVLVRVFWVLLLLLILFLIFRRLMGRRSGAERGDGGLRQSRERLDSPAERRAQSVLARDARAQVRRAYRRFLRFCTENGVSLRRSDTSRLIADSAASALPDCEGEIDAMRDIYIAARYSEHEISADDAKAARQRLAEIKKRVKRHKEG
ncbi:MAG: DUF4129 domain-containing protein [Clostridia bacterium]|nr:DUF4129 domain-containing protein [Clostridia bacterium]